MLSHAHQGHESEAGTAEGVTRSTIVFLRSTLRSSTEVDARAEDGIDGISTGDGWNSLSTRSSISDGHRKAMDSLV